MHRYSKLLVLFALCCAQLSCKEFLIRQIDALLDEEGAAELIIIEEAQQTVIPKSQAVQTDELHYGTTVINQCEQDGEVFFSDQPCSKGNGQLVPRP